MREWTDDPEEGYDEYYTLYKSALTADEADKMGITVRLNVITGQVEISGMPDMYSRSNAPNTLPTLINDYFSRSNIRITRQLIDDSLVLIEDENRFNPVEEMLGSTTWEGEDRISVLCDILGMRGIRWREFGRFIAEVEKLAKAVTDFDEALWGAQVDHVTVYGKDNIVFTLNSGLEIKA